MAYKYSLMDAHQPLYFRGTLTIDSGEPGATVLDGRSQHQTLHHNTHRNTIKLYSLVANHEAHL